jgi:hypothetical protein
VVRLVLDRVAGEAVERRVGRRWQMAGFFSSPWHSGRACAWARRDRLLGPLGVTSTDGDGLVGTATSRSSRSLGAPESVMAEPPNRAALTTAALTTTAALAEAIRRPVLVTLPSSCTTTPEQVTIR